ncbi:hypothetical protein [Pseudoduganella umbonata]|uniref:Uncharacterized protein n=1 Tax=Pseudoduganella umbonata TaxID=864828 RepID=A0A4P8HQG4_9BURK|nr:hypothetical protein [Pseudoduganella umbonata]MBB3222717.1 hypothetical protein [Pseudoduganella umbonata]QCP10788.1 hypothetical protein FCL38_10350 [Pseudoduganella umbonata]
MRRLFVIFLALLFPLNVLALSMSVAANAPAHTETLTLSAASTLSKASPLSNALTVSMDSQVGEAMCDIDPDEPPAGMDFHDTVHAAPRLPSAAPPDASVSSFVPPRRGRDPLPPIKPPPAA